MVYGPHSLIEMLNAMSSRVEWAGDSSKGSSNLYYHRPIVGKCWHTSLQDSTHLYFVIYHESSHFFSV